MEQRIKGTTGLMALIGSPVGHSGSPAMYNFSFRHHNLDYAYMAFDIKEDQVPAALDAIRLFKMRGANVTKKAYELVDNQVVWELESEYLAKAMTNMGISTF